MVHVFISQEGYVKEILKKFDMNMGSPVNTLIEKRKEKKIANTLRG